MRVQAAGNTRQKAAEKPKAIDFIRPVSMPKAVEASSSSLMHCQKSRIPGEDEAPRDHHQEDQDHEEKLHVRRSWDADKPREPPSTSATLSELSRSTRTSMPKPRVAMARKSSRSRSMGTPIR